MLLFVLFMQATLTLGQRIGDIPGVEDAVSQEPRRIPRFRIDYTQRFMLMNNVHNLVENDPNADVDWLKKSPGHQFSVSILPGFRENWTFGVSFYLQRLLKERENMSDLMPADQFPYNYFDDPIQFRRDVTIYGNAAIVERRLYSTPMEEFRVFTRAEVGFLRYTAKAEIGHRMKKDTTYNFESYSKEKETATVFSGSLGVGVQYQHGFIGAHLIAGYQLQTSHSFLPRNQFNEWKAIYHPENYNGVPNDDQFSIEKDDIPDNKVRFSQLYLQFSVVFFIGQPWK